MLLNSHTFLQTPEDLPRGGHPPFPLDVHEVKIKSKARPSSPPGAATAGRVRVLLTFPYGARRGAMAAVSACPQLKVTSILFSIKK